jgi:hypothetical protein
LFIASTVAKFSSDAEPTSSLLMSSELANAKSGLKGLQELSRSCGIKMAKTGTAPF